METALPQASPALPEQLTIRQAADLYGVSKQAIRQRIAKLPPEAIARVSVEGGKEIIYLTTYHIISAWGAPQDPQSEAQPEEVQELTKTEIAALRADNEALKRTIAAITEQMESTQQERDELQSRMDAESVRAETLLAKIESQREELYTMSKSLTAAETELTGKNTLIETLQAQISAQNLQIDQLHQLQLAALRTALPAPRQKLFARIFGRKQEQ